MWVITRSKAVLNRRFGNTYWSHIQVSFCPKRTSWPLKMGPIGGPKRLFQTTLRRVMNPEDGRIQQQPSITVETGKGSTNHYNCVYFHRWWLQRNDLCDAQQGRYTTLTGCVSAQPRRRPPAPRRRRLQFLQSPINSVANPAPDLFGEGSTVRLRTGRGTVTSQRPTSSRRTLLSSLPQTKVSFF